jgi:hypothetical protein
MGTVASAIPAIVRLMRRIRVTTPDGCWEWQGAKSKGYGRIQVGSAVDGSYRLASTHRVAYEHFVGPIPDGYHIDHLCRNPSCCNPAHLEPVTPGENVRRGNSPRLAGQRMSAKTHCPQNHPYSGYNLVVEGGKRRCRTCINDQARRRYVKKAS